MDMRLAWTVPEKGHTWKTYKGVARLVWNREAKGGFVNRYVPSAGLFREFVAVTTKPSRVEDAILKFADKYGDITAVPGGSFYRFDAGKRSIQRSNAPLRTWRYQIEKMRRAVALWDRSNDAGVGEPLRIQGRSELQIEVESALRDMTTPSCARVCLNARLELFVHPVNLLAFMWLTLARLVSGEIEERRCDICLTHFYVGYGEGLKRADSLTCGDVCRQRKKRAGAKVAR